LVDQYRAVTGASAWYRLEDVYEWAKKTGRWEDNPDRAKREFVRQLADALREDCGIDPQGRTVRKRHSIQTWVQGKLVVLWNDMERMSRDEMHASATLRRDAAVHDILKLKRDVDSYNENYNTGRPIPLPLDFTYDVIEREAEEAGEIAQAAA